MAYIGKEFKFEKEENYDTFINELAKSEPKASTFLTFKPNHTLQKNGDEYTLVLTMDNFKKEISFKPGVEFEEVLGGGAVKAKSVVSVDGDTFTQVQTYDKGSLTLKREYSPNQLKVTVTSTFNDVTAYRYYIPA